MTSTVRDIELLAPARDKECGMEAIRHGADAVYVGAPQFGARAAAGNSIEDIAELTEFAHLYRAKIYVALNTLLTDEELVQVERMIEALYRVGVDALIVQDMGITRLKLPPIPLHASTQTDNRSAEKVDFLFRCGFTQIVLARELSLDEISAIHRKCPDARLEVFVHGALCVSYSGRCYVSQALFGRSANRGECAQFCRLPFDLRDAEGKAIVEGKHLLSLKDLNQSNRLEDLLEAGASSLKIEGRLKDVAYVKNVTAYYRRILDRIIETHPEKYRRASSGKVCLNFSPALEKSFNRGFTSYFLQGRVPDIAQFSTPKSLGEEMGTVKELRGNVLTMRGVRGFHNGDGAFFVDQEGKTGGFRVNRVEGNKLFLAVKEKREFPAFLKPGVKLYRNYDAEFEKILSHPTAERKIRVWILLRETLFGFVLTIRDEDGVESSLSFPQEKTEARIPQREQIIGILGKLGNTAFEAVEVKLEYSCEWFIPAARLAEWRRNAVDSLYRARRLSRSHEQVRFVPTFHAYPDRELTYQGNVMNHKAREFYRDHGVERVAPAFELETPSGVVSLMYCRYCIRYALDACPVHHKKRLPYREPYYLQYGERRFKLIFDCRKCEMTVNLEE